MKRSLRLSLLVLVPLFLVVATGIAFARGMHRRGDPGHMKQFIESKVNATLDDLAATDAQRTQIVGIVDGLLDKMNAAREAHRPGEFFEAVAAAVESNNADTSAIDQLIDEHAARQAAFAHDAVNAGKSVSAILTPEQRAKLASKIRDRASRGPDHGPF